MAFWGAPLPDENHKQNATKAAIEMRIALEELNERLREEGLDQINTGAGINTGDCVVGNFMAAALALITVSLVIASIWLLG